MTALAALAQDVQPATGEGSPKTTWRLDLSAVTTSDSSQSHSHPRPNRRVLCGCHLLALFQYVRIHH